MSFTTILLTAFALSMDAFAVSVTKGMTLKNISKGKAIKIALFFGLFQGGMPLLGWALGISFEGYIKSIDHWIALTLLCFIGFNMINEFIKDHREASRKINSLNRGACIYDSACVAIEETSMSKDDCDLSTKELIILSIATSIDALAVGVSFAFLNIDIISVSISICFVTFLVCVFGVYIGKKFGDMFKSYAELMGGIILVFIGINIFNEHTNLISNILQNLF